MIEPWVRDILSCPACGAELADGGLADGAAELVCTSRACALAFPVVDGIPVLLVDQSYPSTGRA
jgi:uncharacterized protein YbaR (Trm112 family)